MSIYDTIQIGDPVLRETARTVGNFRDADIITLIDDLKDTMLSENLVGLAAPQLGDSRGVIVTEVRADNWRNLPPEPFTVYLNPKVIKFSRETERGYEGCGSIAHGGLFGEVERVKEIKLQYMDINGVSRETSAAGLLARIIKHEIDHLNGTLFTDIADPKSLVDHDFYINNIANA